MDKEFVFLAPLSALIGMIVADPSLACATASLTLLILLYCRQDDALALAREERKALEQAREERKALEDKVEELKAKLEHMALAKIQSETERVLLQYYAMERGGFLRRRIKSSSDIGGLAG